MREGIAASWAFGKWNHAACHRKTTVGNANTFLKVIWFLTLLKHQSMMWNSPSEASVRRRARPKGVWRWRLLPAIGSDEPTSKKHHHTSALKYQTLPLHDSKNPVVSSISRKTNSGLHWRGQIWCDWRFRSPTWPVTFPRQGRYAACEAKKRNPQVTPNPKILPFVVQRKAKRRGSENMKSPPRAPRGSILEGGKSWHFTLLFSLII